jgi:beta-glucosidase-like glycosyl hydrolase
VAYVRGLQRAGVGATVKHFVANDSETERMTLDARRDERTLRELSLAPFEAIIREAGVWSVMAAYNGVNGERMTRAHCSVTSSATSGTMNGSSVGLERHVQRWHVPTRRLTS